MADPLNPLSRETCAGCASRDERIRQLEAEHGEMVATLHQLRNEIQLARTTWAASQIKRETA